MKTAIEKLDVIAMSKAEQKAFVENLVSEIDAGNVDAVRLAVHLKTIEETIKATKGHYKVKEAISDGMADFSEKTFSIYGAEITKKNLTKYDYSRCNDGVLARMIKQQAQLAGLIKLREALLKLGVDPATGETFPKPLELKSEIFQIKIK